MKKNKFMALVLCMVLIVSSMSPLAAFAQENNSDDVTVAENENHTHDVTLAQGHAATCTTDGYKNAYYCNTCKKLFKDKECTEETTMEKLVIPALGHAGTLAKGHAATCTEEGYKDAYYCTNCKKLFEDEKCTKETTMEKLVIPALGHAGTLAKGHAATCTEEGYKDAYYCTNCKKLFEDEKCTKETTMEELVIPALNHDVSEAKGHAATCTEEGYKDAFYCNTCKKLFKDKECTEETTMEELVIPALGHSVKKAKGHEPSCTVEGYKDAYYCERCEKLFKDEACTEETTMEELVIPALGHSVKVAHGHEPSCTVEGYKDAYYCERCEKFFKDEACTEETTMEELVIPALGHDVSVAHGHEATCTVEGYKDAFYCNTCEKLFKDEACTEETTMEELVIPALGHSVKVAHGHEPSCTVEGYKDAYYCERCEKFFKDEACTEETTMEELVIPALGHSVKVAHGHEPSCTVEGYKDAYYCERCEKFFKDEACTEETTMEELVIPALGHDVSVAHGHEATCTVEGYKDAFYCNTCEKLFKDEACTEETTMEELVIPALGHSVKKAKGHEPSCTVEGYKDAYYCERCEKFFKDEACTEETTMEELVIPALGHSVKVAHGHEPSCTVEGYKDAYYCERCEKFFKDEACTEETTMEELVIPALGHDVSVAHGHEATCTVEGYKDAFYCNTCEKLFKDKECTEETTMEELVIPALGHSVKVAHGHEPSCTVEGYKDAYYCERCEKFFKDEACTEETTMEELVIPALGHSVKVAHGHEPSCTVEGYKDAYYCERCEKFFKDEACIEETTMEELVIPALGHSVKFVEGKEATCTEEGTKGAYYCERCGKYYEDESCTKEITEEELVIPALGHSVKFVEGKEATCTEEGTKGAYYCERCGKYYEDESCTKEITEEELVIPALGHSVKFVEGKEATCTEEGTKGAYYCERCGKYYEDESCTKEITEEELVIPALGHSVKFVEGKEATCTEEGTKGAYYCERCGKYYEDESCTKEITEEELVIPALGHSVKFVEGKEATCTEEGTKGAYYCERCGKYYEDESCTKEITEEELVIAALGHHIIKVEAKAPTATEEGNIVYWYCDRCGKYFKDEALTQEIAKKDTIISALGTSTEKKDDTKNKQDKSENNDNPETADQTNVGLYTSLFGVGGLLMVMAGVLKKKKTSENK